MQWEEKAMKYLEKVPEFAREIAKVKIEERVKEKGRERVSIEDVEEVYSTYFGKEDGVKNIAIVRCDIISEVCPGVGCLKAYEHRLELFRDYGRKTRLVGFFTCGGCPGRRVFRLVNTLRRYGVDAVHMSSCMLMDEPFTRCPHKNEIKKSIEGLGVDVVEGTHHEVGQYAGGIRFHKK